MLTFTNYLKARMRKSVDMMANCKLDGGDGPLSYNAQIRKFSEAAYCLHLYRHGDNGYLVRGEWAEYVDYRDAKTKMLAYEAASE